MNVVEILKRADELYILGQDKLAFETYLFIVDAYRKGKCKLTDDVLLAYNNAVVLAFELADSKEALREATALAEEFVRVVRKTDNSELYASACYFAGMGCNALGDYKKAMKYLEEAMIVFELLGDDEKLMLASKQYAEACRGAGFETKARVYEARAKALAGEKETLAEATVLLKKLKSLPLLVRRV